jgi:hypothetical protein
MKCNIEKYSEENGKKSSKMEDEARKIILYEKEKCQDRGELLGNIGSWNRIQEIIELSL